MGRIVFAITCILSCASCEYEYDYKYISLEKIKEIQITSYGRPDRSAFVVDHDMPMRYELERKTYIVTFGIDKDYHWPNILVSAKSFSADSLMIEPIETGGCGYFDNSYDHYRIDDMKAWKYVWMPSYRKNCPVKGRESHPPDQIISFRVKNQKGEILGEERLPFILVENGTYYEIDAL